MYRYVSHYDITRWKHWSLRTTHKKPLTSLNIVYLRACKFTIIMYGYYLYCLPSICLLKYFYAKFFLYLFNKIEVQKSSWIFHVIHWYFFLELPKQEESRPTARLKKRKSYFDSCCSLRNNMEIAASAT